MTDHAGWADFGNGQAHGPFARGLPIDCFGPGKVNHQLCDDKEVHDRNAG
jgi:hypothetical protein